jgi:DNA-binding response OmpR family regulator
MEYVNPLRIAPSLADHILMISSPYSRPIGVLVVEDEPLILQLVTRFLRTFGVEVFAAPGAAEAERLLRDHADSIDAAMIDLNMPVTDGLETQRRLSRVKPALCCCLMTGAGMSGGSLPDGFCLALDKPFGLAQLRAFLERMCPQGCAEGRVG